MDSGLFLFTLVTGLYIAFGPLVILFIYVILDKLAERDPMPKRKLQEKLPMSLWTRKQTGEYVSSKQH